MDRRRFVGGVLGGLATGATGIREPVSAHPIGNGSGGRAEPMDAAAHGGPRPMSRTAASSVARLSNPVGVSTYSFQSFRGERPTVLECIDIAADMGFDGVEILHKRMKDESPATLQRLKARAHTLGMTLMGFSTHQGFLTPDPAERQRNVELTIRQVEMAAAMGIPAMRVNTGRWGTMRSFNQLMEDRGIELLR